MYLCDCFFYFNETAPTQIYTLSLHDALPISLPHEVVREVGGGREVLPRGAPHSIGAERERGEERRQDADDRLERVHGGEERDRKSTRLNSSHSQISYAVFCLKQKKYSTISV